MAKAIGSRAETTLALATRCGLMGKTTLPILRELASYESANKGRMMTIK